LKRSRNQRTQTKRLTKLLEEGYFYNDAHHTQDHEIINRCFAGDKNSVGFNERLNERELQFLQIGM